MKRKSKKHYRKSAAPAQPPIMAGALKRMEGIMDRLHQSETSIPYKEIGNAVADRLADASHLCVFTDDD